MSASLQEAPPDSATTTTPAVLDGDSTSVAPNQALSIVFTDIEESTALWETVPDSMRIALQLHDDIMRAGIRAHNGYEVKVIGDGFMVAFQKANDALTWCLDTQWDLLNADWPPEVLTASYAQEVRDKHGHLVFRGLRVRMSIHWGTPIILVNSITRRLEYIGPMVHRTARCMSIAKGGQLVVTHDFLTELARSLGVAEFQDGEPQEGIDGQADPSSILSGSKKKDFEVKDLGEYTLKGLSEALHIYLIISNSLRGRLEYSAPPGNPSDSSAWIPSDSALWTWWTG